MWHAADIADKIRHAEGYQFKGPGIGAPQFSWATFKPQRDAYIRRLNGIYDTNVGKEGVEQHHGRARVLVVPAMARAAPPALRTVGEALDFVGQVLEVRPRPPAAAPLTPRRACSSCTAATSRTGMPTSPRCAVWEC